MPLGNRCLIMWRCAKAIDCTVQLSLTARLRRRRDWWDHKLQLLPHLFQGAARQRDKCRTNADRCAIEQSGKGGSLHSFVHQIISVKAQHLNVPLRRWRRSLKFMGYWIFKNLSAV